MNPIKALEHRYWESWPYSYLILGLAVSPLRRFLGLNLLKFRRAMGVLTFTYVSLHLLVWLVLDVQVPSQIWADIRQTTVYHRWNGRLCADVAAGDDLEQLVGAPIGPAVAQFCTSWPTQRPCWVVCIM